MKSFVLKILIFFLILVTINQIIITFSPYWWGNQYYAEKIKYINERPEGFNTFFFGSSRIYRQLDPKIFDSIVDKTTKVRSFNLASPSAFNPESYYLLEKFLQNEEINIKYILIELQEIKPIADLNLNTSQAKYWMNLSEYLFTLKYYLSRIDCEKDTWRILRNFTITFIENSLNTGMIKHYLTRNHNDLHSLGDQKDGFYPIEDQLNFSMKERRTLLLSDTAILHKKLLKYKKIFSDPVNRNCNEKVHFRRIEKLINYAKEKNIQVIFIIPPLLNDYKKLKGLFDIIPEKNKINMADANKYPELYRFENAWDRAHLNNKGASKFTTSLAHEFVSIIISNLDENLTKIDTE